MGFFILNFMAFSFFFFFLSLDGNVPVPGPVKVYYIRLEVSNYRSDDVSLKWLSDNIPRQQISQSSSKMIVNQIQVASTQPADVNFTAVDSNGVALYLNNMEVLTVTPTIVEETVTVILGNTYK